MARTNSLTNFLTDVADSIRAKKGTTGEIQASNFDTEIASIETSGGNIDDYFSEEISAGSYYTSTTQSGWYKNFIKWRSPLKVNGTSCYAMFSNFPFEMPELEDTSSVTDMSYMFYSYNGSVIKQINTSNVTNFSNFLYYANKVTSLPLLDFSNAQIIGSWAFYATGLKNIEGLKDIGKAYDITQSANYSGYKLDLSRPTELTEQSLINVLNNLYDIATKGCNTQQVVLGTTNLNKLTSE